MTIPRALQTALLAAALAALPSACSDAPRERIEVREVVTSRGTMQYNHAHQHV